MKGDYTLKIIRLETKEASCDDMAGYLARGALPWLVDGAKNQARAGTVCFARKNQKITTK